MSEKLHRMVDGVKVELTDEEEAELRAEWAANEAKAKTNAYADARRSEYPRIEDQLDMIFKDQRDGTTVWRDLIQEIKNKHPKPVDV